MGWKALTDTKSLCVDLGRPLKSKPQIIRALHKDDLDDVARLFQKTFRSSAAASPAVKAALSDTFLNHPHADDELTSQVLADETGKVGGFIGIIPVKMVIEGRPVRAACAGSMMVERPSENPLAGVRLLRSFLSGPQDVSISETANATALRMWRGLGHGPLTAYSLNWLRLLRPGAAVGAITANVHPAGRLLKPFGKLADGVARLARIEPFRLQTANPRAPVFRDADAPELAEALLTLATAHTLQPDWNEGTLRWLLRQASEKPLYGKIVRRVAYEKDGSPLGAYVYYGRPGGIAWTLQLLARPERVDATLDDMLHHAHDAGCAAIRGSGQPWLTAPLLSRKALFLGRSFTVAHTQDAEIRRALDGGAALISGLAGETWSPLIGNRFN